VLDRLRKGKHLFKDERLARLTAQEERILELVAAGRTNKQIGEELHLAEKTVKNYVSSILAKLEVTRRAEAASYLTRHTTTRTWAVEATICDRVLNDSRASLDAQRIEANLLRAAGRAAKQPLKDPSPWLGRSGSGLRLRSNAGQAVRAALFPDPRTAVYATLEKLRYLPGDPVDGDSCRGACGRGVWRHGWPNGCHRPLSRPRQSSHACAARGLLRDSTAWSIADTLNHRSTLDPYSPSEAAARRRGGPTMTATIWRTCPSCGASFEQPDRSGRRRVYCSRASSRPHTGPASGTAPASVTVAVSTAAAARASAEV
jgi:DNA-binding CsgD family transcriptional regulator